MHRAAGVPGRHAVLGMASIRTAGAQGGRACGPLHREGEKTRGSSGGQELAGPFLTGTPAGGQGWAGGEGRGSMRLVRPCHHGLP